jgi:DNA invertase Pin-like site-specific DNA recombinase
MGTLPLGKGASMAKISKSQLEKLQKKYKADSAIGKLFGITRQAVHQLRVKYGIKPVMNKNKDRNSDIVKQYARGVSGTALAKRYKLSISQTYRIINENRAKPKKAVKKSVRKTRRGR